MDIVVLLVGGAALLWLGGEALVAGGAGLARRLGMAPVAIGVVLIGFGTSVPELMTSVDAALKGAPAIALGNVIGSNTANILLILGIAAVITPIPLDRESLQRDTWLMVFAALIGGMAVIWGPLDAMDGTLFLLMLTVYLLVTVLAGQEAMPATAGGAGSLPWPAAMRTMPAWRGLALAIPGIAAVVWGADLFVDGAVALATGFGISEAVIGATVVAVGTSLPELSASVVAARRHHPELAVGNVLGSNLFNVLGVLGAAAVAAPIPADDEMLWRDLPAMALATLLLTGLVLRGRPITRAKGAAMLGAYVIYLLVMA